MSPTEFLGKTDIYPQIKNGIFHVSDENMKYDPRLRRLSEARSRYLRSRRKLPERAKPYVEGLYGVLSVLSLSNEMTEQDLNSIGLLFENSIQYRNNQTNRLSNKRFKPKFAKPTEFFPTPHYYFASGETFMDPILGKRIPFARVELTNPEENDHQVEVDICAPFINLGYPTTFKVNVIYHNGFELYVVQSDSESTYTLVSQQQLKD